MQTADNVAILHLLRQYYLFLCQIEIQQLARFPPDNSSYPSITFSSAQRRPNPYIDTTDVGRQRGLVVGIGRISQRLPTAAEEFQFAEKYIYIPSVDIHIRVSRFITRYHFHH
jgi:hypothetical protein